MGLLLALTACAGRPPSADQRRATDLNPSGRPYDGPRTMALTPPVDTNYNRLYCHPEGPGSVCSRGKSGDASGSSP